jgi:hypothetical protein
MPDIPIHLPQTKRLNKSVHNKRKTFLERVDNTPLKNQKLRFDDNIICTYQRKFIKIK